MHNSSSPDIVNIKRQAKRRAKTDRRHSYMQHLDLVARELYGVRHFHEARALNDRAVDSTTGVNQPPDLRQNPTQHYLQTLQEYYLDF